MTLFMRAVLFIENGFKLYAKSLIWRNKVDSAKMTKV